MHQETGGLPLSPWDIQVGFHALEKYLILNRLDIDRAIE